MMTDNELVYISVILQLLKDGNADTSHLSPTVRSFIEGILLEYEGDPEDPVNELLYYAADTYLTSDIKDYH